jgi:putative ABC transport system permease protein
MVGYFFEINDREARIVAICKSDRAFFGYPYVFTTYDQALQFAPRQRKMLSAVLAEPAAGLTAQEAVDQINRNVPGMKAWTEEKFHRDTIIWYFKNTGIPISFGVTIILGFIVGIAISGQTFYGFVLENLKNLGALKAMGASNFKLGSMLIAQVMTVGLIGYGLGMGAASLFGALAAERGNPPFFLPWQLVAGVLAVILVICLLAAALAIVKVGRLEAAVVFRG